MIFYLEDDFCVIDGNKCEQGQIYCSEECRQKDDISQTTPPQLEDVTSSNDSIYSSSPTSSIDYNLLQTPVCHHHFMYDSKFVHNKNCNCKSASSSDPEIMDLNYSLQPSYNLKQDMIPMNEKKNSILSVLNYDNKFDKELEENRYIKNSFQTAKDNYRLWLSTSKPF